jgi:hypothetical protein
MPYLFMLAFFYPPFRFYEKIFFALKFHFLFWNPSLLSAIF